TRVSPTADASSRMFSAEVTIPNADGALKPGMIAAVEVDHGRVAVAPATMLVPLNAIVRPPGKARSYAVYVIDKQGAQDVARLRTVELGDIGGNQIQVKQGLAGGEQVIVRGATLAVDALPVRIIP